MKIKVSEASGQVLDWMVGCAVDEYIPCAVPAYSTDWAQGGPIIERETIGLVCQQPESTSRCAYRQTPDGEVFYYYGPTPLIAAMRCFVTSVLGDEVEVPDELA